MAERISYVTTDDVTIVGDWSPAATMVGVVILVHMMPMARASWALFLRSLNKRGLAGLAIDLRGHGESVIGPNGRTLDYREFTDEEHQSSIWDIYGAVDWVRKRDVELSRIALCGASFGANLCLRELAEEPTIPGAALLSPGENYRGVMLLEDAQKLGSDQALFITASEEDTEAFASSRKLFDEAPVHNKTFLPYKGAGHGTTMFTSDAKLMEKTADWLRGVISGK